MPTCDRNRRSHHCPAPLTDESAAPRRARDLPVSSEPLAPGARIGRYEVVAHLATGGMGQVYKARDVELERVVALKLLPAHVADNPVMVERFRREARNAARLTHKNIVTLYDWGQDGGTWFLALEFIEGTDLSRYIAEQGQLHAEEAWRITVQAVRALDHAFQQGITHRDIKPSNFMLVPRGRKFRVKLTDFGLARADHDDDFRVTRDGTTVGTLDYMSPEQARDSALADVRSDVYSLGCTLYHMLAGRPPFAEGGLGERVFRHQQVEPEDVRQFNPGVPEGLWLVLSRMLAKRPEDRYQTPVALLDALIALGVSADEALLGERSELRYRTRAEIHEAIMGLGVPASDSSEGGAGRAPDDGNAGSNGGRATQLTSPTAAWAPATDAEVEGVGNVDRWVAAEQFQRAGEMLNDPAQQLAAREVLSDCCRLDPSVIAYRRALRRVARELRRRDDPPPIPDGARERFDAARQGGDHQRVLEHGEEVLAASPDDLSAHQAMADAAAALNLPELQAWLLKQACKHQPANVELRRGLARAYERHKDIARAIAVWREIRKARPNDAEAAGRIEALLRLLARAYERQSDRQNAVAVWEAVLKLRPQDAEAQERICALLLSGERAPTDEIPTESV
jgi:serine/threonine protein kinase